MERILFFIIRLERKTDEYLVGTLGFAEHTSDIGRLFEQEGERTR